MAKYTKYGLFLLAVILISVLWIFMHRISLVDLIEPLKNNEEIEYIRIETDKGSREEGLLVEIRDKEVITSLKEQMEKVRLKYVGSSRGISYTSEDYLLIVHINAPENQFTVNKNGSIYCNDKKYVAANDEASVLFEKLEQAESLNESKELILPNDFFNNEGIGENAFANLCLSSFYDSPKDVDLEELFYNGFGLEINESDRNFLEMQGAEMDYDVIKLPKSDMNKILKKYFGISLQESNWVGVEKFYYNEETDTYYLVHNDFHECQVNILDQFIDEKGNINVVYSKLYDEKKCIAVIKKEDENYLFLSNSYFLLEN